jgi:hypothetical protein
LIFGHPSLAFDGKIIPYLFVDTAAVANPWSFEIDVVATHANRVPYILRYEVAESLVPVSFDDFVRTPCNIFA